MDNKGKSSLNTSTSRAAENKPAKGGSSASNNAIKATQESTAKNVGKVLDR